MSSWCDQFTDPFWSQVDIRTRDECWPWTGLTQHGYGVYTEPRVDGARKHTAYRAHIVAYGGNKIPLGMVIRHLCHNRACCNPAHLLHGTQQQNMDDMVAAGRHARGERGGTAKLTNEQAEEIRRLYETGLYNQAELGKKYGISQSNVSGIVRGRTYLPVLDRPRHD